jgi:type I restriction-modification system DNA methylase subunit
VFNEVALNGKLWSDPSVTKLRVADFACGTGSLLCGAYNEMRRHLELKGVSARKLHAAFIENSLVGCDVMPSATHITASMLSSAFPEERYKHTNILTLPFGRQTDGSVSLGALEFLSTQGALSIIDTGASGVGASGVADADPWAVIGGTGIADGSFDLVIMNPPFTRLTGGGGKTSEIPLPMFAAFGNEKDEQELMSARAKN